MKVPMDKLVTISKIVADLHSASLLVDDIEDNSKLRRGVPVAHEIYGIPQTINCANYVYYVALENCFMLDSREAMGWVVAARPYYFDAPFTSAIVCTGFLWERC